jgi:glutamate N-acetyltransferase/amino-acid N-acetyltransferase
VSVTAAAGFRAAGVAAGLKSTGAADVALVVNDGPSDVAAAVFTSNRCKANPVLWSEQVLTRGAARAVILNSGGANCYTGPAGFQTTHATAEAVGELLGVGAGEVVVCSTGLIGTELFREKVIAGAAAAADDLAADGGDAAAHAIMTTDTVDKQASVAGGGWTVGGMAKGAGMLAPALATMLVVLTTDAEVDAATADAALRAATRTTFDRLDGDGCMSTNDTVLLMVSGASGVAPTAADFTGAVTAVCRDLAVQLQADVEGSEHDITITVTGAATEDDAVEVARSIARSNLFKCAVYGEDPNWGRVLASVGTTRAAFDPARLDVSMNGVQVCRDSVPHESRDLVHFTGRAVSVEVELHSGAERATVWTCDLTPGYVHENSAYAS